MHIYTYVFIYTYKYTYIHHVLTYTYIHVFTEARYDDVRATIGTHLQTQTA